MRWQWAPALALLVAGCAAPPPPSPSPAPDPNILMPSLETRIYELVDRERHKLAPSAPVLALDSELVGVARAKSADMATRHYAAHASPTGETSAAVLMARDAHFEGVLGENIAAQPYLPRYGVDVERFAEQIVATWVASQSHRANLADPAYLRTGVGAAVDGNTVYVTQLFAADLSSAAGQQLH